MKPFTILTGRVATLPVNNIDTDQIIPASYLKVTDKAGLGAGLFSNWRYRADGTPNPDFILNKPGAQGVQALLAGHNFGCGSSREHAPWALTAYGIRAVISTSFADIFRNNALKNGLLTVVVDESTHMRLLDAYDSDTAEEITIDLAAQKLTLPDGSVYSFQIDNFSKTCLLNGTDELGYLLSFSEQITAFERKREAPVAG